MEVVSTRCIYEAGCSSSRRTQNVDDYSRELGLGVGGGGEWDHSDSRKGISVSSRQQQGSRAAPALGLVAVPLEDLAIE